MAFPMEEYDPQKCILASMSKFETFRVGEIDSFKIPWSECFQLLKVFCAHDQVLRTNRKKEQVPDLLKIGF